MRKKILTLFLVIILIILFVLGIYKVVEFLNYKKALSNLEEYIFIPEEKIIKSFVYDKKDYVISMYYDDTSTWSHLNLLLKDKNNYYILQNIKKCDTTDYCSNLDVKNNEIYIHCIGKKGDIDKYSINNFKVEKETLNFDYKNTPNTSQLHIGIDNIDDEYIYLSSITMDSTIREGEKVKCSLKDKICNYY